MMTFAAYAAAAFFALKAWAFLHSIQRKRVGVSRSTRRGVTLSPCPVPRRHLWHVPGNGAPLPRSIWMNGRGMASGRMCPRPLPPLPRRR